MSKLIVLSGKKRVGKDTVAKLLVEKSPRIIHTHSLADYIKYIIYHLLGHFNDDDKDIPNYYNGKSLRDYYRLMGKFIVDNFGKDFIINKFINSYLNYFTKNCDYMILTDMKFKNEYDKLKGLNPIFIRIKRNTGIIDDHYTETDLDDIPDSEFDYIIDNNGSVDDLKIKVNNILSKL